MTHFELRNKTVKEVKRIVKWALENAENKQSAKLIAKDEHGSMMILGPNEDLELEDMSELIDEESTKMFDIELRDTPYGKKLIVTIDVYKDGNTYMMYLGLEESFFDDLERQDIISKVGSHEELAIEGYA